MSYDISDIKPVFIVDMSNSPISEAKEPPFKALGITPTHFRTVQLALAAATPVWTPTAGKKFRLLGLLIQLGSAALAAAAESTLTLLDGADQIELAFDFWVPTVPALPSIAANIALDIRPNGYLSRAINNVLNATLTADLADGHFRILVWGTEET